MTPSKLTSLSAAIEDHVEPGDTLQVMLGHSRWTAAARELARQFWGREPGFTLVMASLGSLAALFFRGGLLSKVLTAYSGDSFPTYGPNPIFADAYQRGEVEVEHWSFLSLTQRLEAAARGLPASVTASLAGSDMVGNHAYCEVPTPFGQVGMVEALAPDVCLLHAAAADQSGNLVMSEPLLEGLWGAWAARRGVVATVDAVVDDLHGLGARVHLPGERVLAVAEAPFGAHPGGCYAAGLPARSYGEDIAFWIEAAAAARKDFDGWARTFALEPKDQAAYLGTIGPERLRWLEARSDPASWKEDADAHPVPTDEPVSAWERAAVLATREVLHTAAWTGAKGLLAGAGVANLAAWVAADRARAEGRPLPLTAELGMWDYRPTPADPYIFNHRVFPGTTMLCDAQTVLGVLVGGPRTPVIACLGAAQIDQQGNINSTRLADGRFLVGSGGGNDVASRARACVVVTQAKPQRLPASVDYITSPGERVVSIVTERGVLRRLDGEFRVQAVPLGEGTNLTGKGAVERAVSDLRQACGWDPPVARQVEVSEPVTSQEVTALREYDRLRVFLA